MRQTPLRTGYAGNGCSCRPRTPRGTSDVLIAIEIRLHRGERRLPRVEVDRHIERLGTFPNRPVFVVVEEAALLVPMDHRALEAQLLHRAFQLTSRGLRIRRWQRGEPFEARWMLFHSLVEPLI